MNNIKKKDNRNSTPPRVRPLTREEMLAVSGGRGGTACV